MRTWDAENPHVFVERPLHPEKIGVWAAVSGRRLIGPIFFEGKIILFKKPIVKIKVLLIFRYSKCAKIS